MEDPVQTEHGAAGLTVWQPDFVYSLVVFATGVALLVYSFAVVDGPSILNNWSVALFFVGFSLYTITMGYAHPVIGHVSFDRVAQVATILVLGPVDAAWISGLASLIYPWQRLRDGVPLRTVVTAALNNAGLMTIVVLAGGFLYVRLGGTAPLMGLGWETIGFLAVMAVVMQIINDVGMMAIVYLKGADMSIFPGRFRVAVELGSCVIGVLVAIVFNRMELEVFVLLLGVLSMGMLVLKKFAHMRQKLELLVEERTRELEQKSRELEQKATHDKLTGLLNRRYSDDYLDRQIEELRRDPRAFTLALADIDFFKRINDQHSHAIGDKVLRRVATILKERCRKSDMVARYGGEEFLLCFPGTQLERANQLCEELRTAVEAEDWAAIAPEVRLTISFGLAEYWPKARRKSLLGAADERLYEAKHGGRNRVVA